VSNERVAFQSLNHDPCNPASRLAAAFLKWLYPVMLIKPHLGLSIGIKNFNARRFILVALLGALSLLVWPGWILQ
jgi:hypothetical protein